MFLTSLFLFVVGISLGLLGAGGSAIAVPVLVYIGGMNAHEAVTLSLLLIGLVSLLGAALHARSSSVRWQSALTFAVPGMLGSWIGSSFSRHLSQKDLLIAFGIFLAPLGIHMLLEKTDDAARTKVARGFAVTAMAGFGIGIITGTLGVGGGFVIVPAMTYLAGLSMREAIATSLVVITLNSGVAFARHMQFTEIEFARLGILLVCASCGMGIGTYLSNRLHPEKLKQGFGALLIGMSIFLVYENLFGFR